MANGSAVTNTPMPRSWTRDGWYDDEFAPAGKLNPATKCRFNKFNVPPDFDKLGTGTAIIPNSNPLENSAKTRVLEQGTGNPQFGKADWFYWCFAPPAVRANPPATVKLSILFGSPGPVMNRHGLRHYFEGFKDRIFINTEGTEDDPRFGIGITLDMIDDLVAKATGKAKGTVKVALDVLAAYSTGFRGMNGSILNIFNDPELKPVRKLIYYDCLYAHDKPAPGKNTLRTMERLLALNPQLKIIIYELTGNVTASSGGVAGGTPTKPDGSYWTDFPKSPNANPLSKTNTVTTLNKIKGAPFAAFFTLATARLIDNAIKTGYFDEAFIRKKFGKGGNALMDAIKADLKSRGTYASNQSLTPPGKTWFGQWTSAANVQAIAAVADTIRAQIISDAKFKLLGWQPPDLGDMSHDSHMQEFAWEHMTG